jgi:hypothetical protein
MKYFLLSALILLSSACNSNPPAKGKTQRITVSQFLSEKQFNDLFPQRDKFYSYGSFIGAIKEMSFIKIKVSRRAVSVYQFTRTDKRTGKSVVVRQDPDWNEDWAKKNPDSSYVIDYGNFCSEVGLRTDKKELAAFLAHIAHETRHGENEKYNDGLMLIHESNTALPYTADNDTYPAVSGKKYYGRGPMQLSYNGNYGYASDCIFGNKNVLLNNPGLIETDAVVAFKTAIYFWMTRQTYRPSAHDVMIGKWRPNAGDIAANRVPGFGMTINIVNGEVECNKGENVYSMNDRIGFYRYFLKELGVSDINCACSCGKMKPY